MIEFYSEDTEEQALDIDTTVSWIEKIIAQNNKEAGDITVIFCSDEYILKVNREYLKHDYYTDIITFDYCEDDIISGDLFISVDTVADNAKRFDTTYNNELMRVIIHGVLHLIGFNDKTDSEQEEMTKQENISLSLLNELLNS